MKSTIRSSVLILIFNPFVEEHLICIHAFCGPTVKSLHKTNSSDSVGVLRYAVKVAGPTYAQMKEIRFPSYINTFTGEKETFSRSDIFPLIEVVEPDEGFVEYYASQVDFFSLEAAHKLWSAVEIAAARVKFDRWLKSADGALERPSNLLCQVLRRCMDEAKIIEESILSQRSTHKAENDFLLPKQSNSTLQQQVVPDEISSVLPDTSPTRSSKSGVESLSKALSRHPYPYSDEERAQWVTAKEAAQIEKTVDAASLRKYRACARDGEPAEKTPDGLAGRDCDGRIWRKSGEHSHVIYLLASLRNYPKTSSKTSAKRVQKRG